MQKILYGGAEKDHYLLKRLLGLNSLSIWKGRSTTAIILNLDEAVNRISYFYANPAKDNFESCIERVPGLSSFKGFRMVWYQVLLKRK